MKDDEYSDEASHRSTWVTCHTIGLSTAKPFARLFSDRATYPMLSSEKGKSATTSSLSFNLVRREVRCCGSGKKTLSKYR